MAWYAKFDGVDGSGESRGAPSVSETVVTKHTDGPGGMGQVSWGLDRIDQRTPAGDTRGEFPYIVSVQRTASDSPGIINFGLGDGSVRHVDMQDADPFFAYGDGFLGGVNVPTASPGNIHLEIIYAPLGEPDVGGLVVEVPDVEAKGPHMLMTAGFLF